MGRAGSALDNAVIESWHSTLESELREREHFATKAEARRAVADFIDDYNRDRRHSSIGMISPIAFEQAQHPSSAHNEKDTSHDRAAHTSAQHDVVLAAVKATALRAASGRP
jgi:hypothetical protein